MNTPEHRHDHPHAGHAQGAHAHGVAAADTKTVIDPVCGMRVDPATAKHRSEHAGVSYFFCNPRCKDKFDAELAAGTRQGRGLGAHDRREHQGRALRHRRRPAVHAGAESGHVINVASVAGHKVGSGGAVYAATKHAVRVISEGLRQEVKPYGIRSTVISPGAVATELPESITEPDVAERIRKLYEIAIPADAFARAVAFAMSQPEDVDINEILFRPTRQEY